MLQASQGRASARLIGAQVLPWAELPACGGSWLAADFETCTKLAKIASGDIMDLAIGQNEPNHIKTFLH